MALDRSLRSIDADGHMRVEESRISKACVSPYLGREIPNAAALGLDPAKTYRLFRDPAELEKGAASFSGKPLLVRHVPIDADAPQKQLWVGTVGTVTFEAPYLVARPLMVLTAEAIRLIESEEQKELSAAYRYTAEMVPGTYGGEAYDGRMVNIQGNHVAIVSEGRVGSDVHVADEQPREFRKMKSVAAAVAAAIKPYLGKDPKNHLIAMALDGMLGETPAESVISLDEEEKKAAIDAFKEEQGSDEEPNEEDREKAYEKARDKKARDKKARDKRARDKAAKDAAKARDEREAAVDAREEACDAREAGMDEGKEDDEAKDRKRARDARKAARDARHGGRDAMPDPNDHRRDFRSGDSAHDAVTQDELNAAVESAVKADRKRSTDAAIAREKVRPLVGVVSMALDNAPDIYRFALKHVKVEAKDVHDSALGALVDMAVQQKGGTGKPAAAVIAADAKTAELTDIEALFGSKVAA